MENVKSIGVFDSGFGGLTILQAIREKMPQYDYIYLGDNARAPYGPRSFDVIYEFTLQAVEYLFEQDIDLIILACNTASAKALRTIQQKVLPIKYPGKRVLGVIRPITEDIQLFSSTNTIGILATEGTVRSESYIKEIHKFNPTTNVFQHACPLWVPIIESGEFDDEESKAIFRRDIRKLLEKSENINTIILACTHYPIIYDIIREFTPKNIQLIAQGPIIADKLNRYLGHHTHLKNQLSKKGTLRVLTTENSDVFNDKTKLIFQQDYHSQTIHLK